MSSGKTIGLIKAVGGTGGGGGTSNAVQYIPQELTESQQMQARKNLALPYETYKEFDWAMEFGSNPFPITVETVDNGYGTVGESEYLRLMVASGKAKVVFDGVEYNCEIKTASSDDTFKYIGSEFDGVSAPIFNDDYPFTIIGGAVLTKTPGTHTIDLAVYEPVIEPGKAGPCLIVFTEPDNNSLPSLRMDDVKKIVDAFRGGITVRIAGFGISGIYAQVFRADEHFIGAYGFGVDMKMVDVATYTFYTSNGSLYGEASSRVGNVLENGNNYPVLYINNRNYKINVDSNGFLTASILK